MTEVERLRAALKIAMEALREVRRLARGPADDDQMAIIERTTIQALSRLADFESGSGWYEGRAHEFQLEINPGALHGVNCASHGGDVCNCHLSKGIQ